jgi:hypothetical protein
MNCYIKIRANMGETRYVAFELTEEQAAKLVLAEDEYIAGACVGEDDVEDNTWE